MTPMRKTRRFWFGLLGWLTLVGVFGLIASVFLTFFHAPITQAWMEEDSPWAIFGFFMLAAVGTLSMIVHLNVTDELSEEEKSSWRSLLAIGGPLAACFYFFRGGRSPNSRALSRMGKVTWNRPFRR